MPCTHACYLITPYFAEVTGFAMQADDAAIFSIFHVRRRRDSMTLTSTRNISFIYFSIRERGAISRDDAAQKRRQANAHRRAQARRH